MFLSNRTWVDLRPALSEVGLEKLVWGITGVKPNQSHESAGDGLHPVTTVRRAFVLMPFRDPFNKYFTEIFEPALEAASYSVKRADDFFTPHPIMLDIQKSIVEADLILCEMSERNPNVFYELGLAHAIGKPAILVSRKKGDIPFDLSHIRSILYDISLLGWESELRNTITAAAQAVVGLTEVWPPPLTTVRLLTTEREWYREATSAMGKATTSIDDASLTPSLFGRGYQESDQYYALREEIIARRRIRYRYVAVFSSPTEQYRLKMVKKWIKEHGDWNKVFVHYYRSSLNEQVPMLNLLVVDEKKVLIALFDAGQTEQTLFVQDHAVTNYFRVYFEYYFRGSVALHRGSRIEEAYLKEIEKNVML